MFVRHAEPTAGPLMSWITLASGPPRPSGAGAYTCEAGLPNKIRPVQEENVQFHSEFPAVVMTPEKI